MQPLAYFYPLIDGDNDYTSTMKKVSLIFIYALGLSVIPGGVRAQLHFYEETYSGGVTMGGWSPNVFGVGNGAFDIYIEPGSTILKAYIVVSRLGPGDGIVTLNGTDYALDASNQTTGPFVTAYGDPSAVHTIDVTSDINPATLNYTIAGGTPYQDFQLVVFYENASLGVVTGALFLNTFNLNVSSNTWDLNFDSPISNTDDVAMAFFNSYQCDVVGDAEDITVNGNFIGTTGGSDLNSGACTGTLGNFYYQDGVLTALSDDNADEGVFGSDALSNIAGLVSNGDSNVNVLFEHVSGSTDNHQWSIVTAFGTSCIAPEPAFAFTEVCVGETTEFTDETTGGAIEWEWDFDDSNISSDQNPNHTFSNPGNYDVSITATGPDGCSAAFTQTVVVFSVPTILIDQEFDCNGVDFTLTASGATTYLWNPGALANSSIDVAPGIETVFTVQGTDSNGCIAEESSTVIPFEPISIEAIWVSDASCEFPLGGSAQATASGGIAPYNYTWSPNGGGNALGSNMEAGDYTANVTDDLGCVIESNEVTIIQTGLPEVFITGPDTICPGNQAVLIANGANTYVWSNGETTPTISMSPASSDTYTVVGFVGACSSSATFQLAVYEFENWDSDTTFYVIITESVEADLPSNFNYTWFPADGLSCNNCPNPSISPLATTLYNLVLEDAASGCIQEGLVQVVVEYSDAFIPNAITLNNDGVNEVFQVYGGPFIDPIMRIFNRWGIMIFETSDIEKGWDGGVGEYYAPDGVYVYQVSYETDKGRKEFMGTVTVIR